MDPALAGVLGAVGAAVVTGGFGAVTTSLARRRGRAAELDLQRLAAEREHLQAQADQAQAQAAAAISAAAAGLVAPLTAQVTALTREVAELRAENGELRAQVAVLRTRVGACEREHVRQQPEQLSTMEGKR